MISQGWLGTEAESWWPFQSDRPESRAKGRIATYLLENQRWQRSNRLKKWRFSERNMSYKSGIFQPATSHAGEKNGCLISKMTGKWCDGRVQRCSHDRSLYQLAPSKAAFTWWPLDVRFWSRGSSGHQKRHWGLVLDTEDEEDPKYRLTHISFSRKLCLVASEVLDSNRCQ